MTMLHAGNGGMCFIDSVELDEVYTPILVRTRRLIPDSEGAGKYRGAPGIRVEFGPVGDRMQAVFVADGNVHNPKGARGGREAAPSAQQIRHRNGSIRPLPQYCDTWVEDGDTLISTACGGGGYGDPREREPEHVAADVREELITRDRAEMVYGVAVTADGHVDLAATKRLRLP